MAFQDFDQISERRRLERQGKFRKRVTIAVVVTALLLALIGVGLFFLVTKLKHDRKPKPSPSQSPATTQTQYIVNGEKLVKIMCSRTEYKEKCEKTLRDSLGSVPRQSTPKDLLTIAMSATLTDFETAFKKINTTFETDTPQEKAAFEDCKVLFRDAKEEMEYSIRYLRNNNLDNFSTRSFELQILLSAVMSYLQTCIDGIPEGKLKSNTEKALQDSKEFTSNSLALVLDVASFLSSFQNPTGGDPHRHLLGRQISSETDRYSNYEFPSWMEHEYRRMLKANDDKPTPNVTVAKDGSGNFSRISDALATMPPKYEGRYVIYVKEGVYDETVIVTKIKVNVTMYGDGSQKSIITGSKNFVDGASTLQTATFAALGDGFIGKSMGFRNTAGLEKHEAVAARVQADRSIFVNCRFEGYQKTLYVQTHRQFYRACVITGTVDFIFGDAAAVFQQCNIFLRKPLENQQNTIIAQGRIDRHETTGIVLQKCQIRPDDALVPVKTQIKSYLGRPWKEYSRAIVMESTIEDIIQPEGWVAWQGDFALDTLYFGEYANKGDGAKLGERVKWSGYKGAIDKQEAIKFTVGTFLRGKWISDATIPVRLDLYAN